MGLGASSLLFDKNERIGEASVYEVGEVLLGIEETMGWIGDW